MLPACSPYPDELTFSALVRCGRHFNLAWKSLLRIVADKPKRPGFLLTVPISRLAELLQCQPATLLWQHTAFPYASAFIPAASFIEALQGALSSHQGSSRLAAVMQNATAGTEFRRYCPACVNAELSQRGESYWHVSHNLPAVWCCPVHGVYLHETTIEVRNSIKTQNVLPHETAGKPLGIGPVSPVVSSVARLTQSVQVRAQRAALARDGAYYRQLAYDHAWARKGSPISEGAVCRSLAARHSAEFLRSAGLDPDRLAWAALMMRPNVDTPQTTVKHLLLTELLTNPDPGDIYVYHHKSSGPPPTSHEAVDAFYSAQARAQLELVRKSGEVLSTEAFLRRSFCFGTYRHRKAHLPALRSVVLEFRSSPCSVKPLKAGSQLFRTFPQELISQRDTPCVG